MSIITNWLSLLAIKAFQKAGTPVYGNEQKLTKLVLEIGTLQIYSIQSMSEYAAGREPQTYYYTDSKYLTEWKGPFSSVYNATYHYSQHLKALKAALKSATGKEYVEQQPRSNVTMVNFVTKQRHKPENT